MELFTCILFWIGVAFAIILSVGTAIVYVYDEEYLLACFPVMLLAFGLAALLQPLSQ